MNKLLQWNPEFAKNLWLEFSPQRLIVMPAIILLVTVLIFSNMDGKEAWQFIHNAALSGIFIIGLIWGVKTAADAILDEYNEKTWDWQKMSVIGPWKLALGKLFGSTIYNWYGAAFCWLLFVLSSPFMADPANEYKIAILLIIGMISLHGLMMLIALQVIKKADGRTKIKSNRIFIAGILLLIFMGRIVALSFGVDKKFLKLSWYGLEGSATDMAIIASIFYCAWIIAGLYRSMRAELQYFDSPTWWLMFLVSNFIFQYGYFVGIEQLSGGMQLASCFSAAFSQSIFITYFLALSEPKDVVNFRLLQSTLKTGNYKELFRNLPLWMVTLPVAFIFGLLAVVFFTISPADAVTIGFLEQAHMNSGGKALILLIAILGFVIRDMGIMLLLNFSSRAKRADAAMIIYLVLLYLMLPLLMKDLGIGAAFYPDVTANPIMMLIFPLVEAAVVLYALLMKWKQLNSPAFA